MDELERAIGRVAARPFEQKRGRVERHAEVAQRLPVRIELDPAELAAHPLRVGLSTEVEIDISGTPSKSGRALRKPCQWMVCESVSAMSNARIDSAFPLSDQQLAELTAAVEKRFIERAHRVAESLELGVAGANGVLLQKGERYRGR